MNSSIISTVQYFDRSLSKYFLSAMGESSGIVSILMHSLLNDESELEKNLISPQQKITVDHLRQIIDYYLEHDYHFIATDDLINGLDQTKKYVILTFDDGYFNNYLSVDVLQEFKVPAIFFISTNHVIEQRLFWWDVLYREGKKAGASDKTISEEIAKYKTQKHSEIEPDIKRKYGQDAFTPTGDIDRPLTASELKDFANEDYVHLGNHTADHAILTNYSADEVRQQIRECQSSLDEITGEKPKIISYPNGNYSQEIIRIAEEEGLKTGITTVKKKDRLPLEEDELMKLSRFVLYGNDNLLADCKVLRSDFSFYSRLQQLKNSNY